MLAGTSIKSDRRHPGIKPDNKFQYANISIQRVWYSAY